MKARKMITLALVAGFAAGCGAVDQLEKLERFVAGASVGGSADYWLVKGSMGVDDRVALVFGYLDDYAGCGEIAEMLNGRYPAARYTCAPAN